MKIPAVPGVYVIKHKETEKIYIGSTNKLYFRIKNHEYQLRDGIHPNKNLQELYNGSWEDFEVELYICEDVEEAREREQKLLDDNFGREHCLNTCPDAKVSFTSTGATAAAILAMKKNPPTHWVGRKHTEEARRRMSESRAGVPRNLTEEQREEQRSRMIGNKFGLGRRRTEETKRKLAESKWKPVSIDGVEYPSVKHAMEALSLTRSSIDSRLRSKNFPDYFFVGDKTVF